MPLSDDEIGIFWTEGYLVKPSFVARDDLDALRRDLAGLDRRLDAAELSDAVVGWEPGLEATQRRVQQVLHAEQVSPAVERLIGADAIVDVAASLMGPEIGLFQSKLLLKAAEVGGELPWHQDFAYWRDVTEAPLQLNCMIYIEDADRENGCLEIIPGSHLRGLGEHGRTRATFGRYLRHEEIGSERTAFVDGPAGTAIFFGPLLAHRSGPNPSRRPRPSLTIVYAPIGLQGPLRRTLRRSDLGHRFAERSELSGLRRFHGPGPHGGQCAAHYRRRELWKLARSSVEDPRDDWIEVAVSASDSLAWFAARKPISNRLFRFEWARAQTSNRPDVRVLAGAFATTMRTLDVGARVGLAHFEGATYWPTKTALERLADRLRIGSVLVFDEFFCADASTTGAARALVELVDERRIEVELLARADREVAMRIASVGHAAAYSSAGVDWQVAAAGIELDHVADSSQFAQLARSAHSVDVWRRRWNRVRAALARRIRDRIAPGVISPGLREFFPAHAIPRFVGEGTPGGGCPTHERRRELWRLAVSEIADPRLAWCELGVGEGESLDWFALHKPSENRLVGFDSFAGIPEPWAGHPAGHWRCAVYRSNRPDVLVVEGAFAQSLDPQRLRELLGSQIGLMHVDCDLYSSTREALDGLGGHIGPGSLILFDEFYGVPEWYRNEARAFREFVLRRAMRFEYLARSDFQVLVRILSVGERAGWSCARPHWEPVGAGIRLE